MPSILVTGGGRGIGRAIALAFSEPGALVAIASRTRSQLEDTAAEIRSAGAEPVVLPMDVSNSDSVQSAVTQLAERGTRLDVLVNNAGVGGGEPVVGSDEKAWRRIIDTNVVGT